MSDGTETLDLNGPETPATTEVETNSLPADNDTSSEVQDLDALTDSGEGNPDPLQADDEEFEDYEDEGKKYKLPKKLIPRLMKDADYTRKTQTLAEERRALDVEKQSLAQQAQATKELSEDRKKLVLIDDYLEKQSRVDWNRLWQEDPLDTPRKWAEFQHWKGQRETLNSKITEAEENEALEEKRATATRIQEALAEAQKIPGWTPEVGRKVQEHAQSYGLSLKQIDKMIIKNGAAAIKVLHDAYLGRQLVQQKQAAAKAPAVAQEPVKPLAPVATRGASPAARKDLGSMSNEEYFAARKAGRKS